MATLECRVYQMTFSPTPKPSHSRDGDIMHHMIKNILGQRFGRLTVISLAETQNTHARWECVCDCGTIKSIDSHLLRKNITKSCGCLQKELAALRSFKHGDRKIQNTSTEYKSWQAMKDRCHNERSRHYKNYGGRGISVCEKWLNSYLNFLQDMGRCPEGMSLDRIDNNGNYEPHNCRWATQKEQMNNTRRNYIIEYNGVSHTIAEWANIFHIPDGRFRKRIKAGWTIEEAMVP